jgi:aspartate-semialdehyde dehydrogenase
MSKKRIAIVGATGMVGEAMLAVVQKYDMSEYDYTLFSSKRSAGKKIQLFGKTHIVQELNENSFDPGFDVAIFSAGAGISEIFAPIAVEKGAVVVDNSSRFRMNKDVPLVVPEVNPDDIRNHNGIIANPNCSTIQAVVAIYPIYKEYDIKRIIYSTYQAVSGAGMKGYTDLDSGIRSYVDGIERELVKFPYPIFDNCLPHIDDFLENGYTKEEQKMIDETKKIFHDDTIAITATTVRVPVFGAHSESINLELGKEYDLAALKELLSNSPGLVLQDNVSENIYPLAVNSVGKDEVFVGRIRRDFSIKNGLNLWVVSDNVRKGAATNAIQIAKVLLEG